MTYDVHTLYCFNQGFLTELATLPTKAYTAKRKKINKNVACSVDRTQDR